MADGTLVGALDVGGTHVAAALVDVGVEPPRVLRVARAALNPHGDADELLDAFVAPMVEIGEGAHRWGIAMPGPFDYARGVGLFEGVGKFDALFDVHVGAELARRTSRTAAHFAFVNDAAAFTLGEWLAGSAQGVARVIGLTLGTGVGSAFISDGELVQHGDDVPPHGYVYLLTHGGKPLEETVSRRALLRRYAELSGATDERTDVHDLAAMIRAGDPTARRVFDEAFSALGTALAPWVRNFRADRIVVGGGIAGAWELIAEPLTRGLGGVVATNASTLVKASSADAPLVGAAWYAARPSHRSV